MTTPMWVSASDATRTLGVTRATLYAYVSRGMIRSEPGTASTRERRYAREDIDRLKRRAEERRDPRKVAAHALQWGMPVLESALTLVADNALYYRGHDAVALARSASVEAVASLIWTGRLEERPSRTSLSRRESNHAFVRGPFIARAQSALVAASGSDAQAFDLRTENVVRTAWRILDLMTLVATKRPAPSASDRIDVALARG